MSELYRLDRHAAALFDAAGFRFDPGTRTWRPGTPPPSAETVDAVSAAAWLQSRSGHPRREPIGVIGPRDPTPAQYTAAEAVGRGIAEMGFALLCGGRGGIMEAASRGSALAGGVAIGLLPGKDASEANDYASVVVATGIGEARNALIARAALCLVAVGDSYGTLSEVALGLQFGKIVIGLEGAARIGGVLHVSSPPEALALVAACALGRTGGAADRG